MAALGVLPPAICESFAKAFGVGATWQPIQPERTQRHLLISMEAVGFVFQFPQTIPSGTVVPLSFGYIIFDSGMHPPTNVRYMNAPFELK